MQDKVPKAVRYGVYHHYIENGYQYSIATELDLGGELTPMTIDLSWHERFPTNTEQLGETWQHIIRKGKQGLLKRAFTVDVEKYTRDGTVEVFVAVLPHC